MVTLLGSRVYLKLFVDTFIEAAGCKFFVADVVYGVTEVTVPF